MTTHVIDHDNWASPGPAIINGSPEAITTMVSGVNGGASEHPSLPGRRCFVTVGATASFRALVEEVSTPTFLRSLAQHGYTRLDVQCGPDYQLFEQRVNSLGDEDKHGIAIGMFAYTDAMASYMLNCRGEANVRPAGCVISHGGSGTVLEAMRVEAPLIVVVNPTLMDNHQLELAQSLADSNLAVHGQLGDLPAALARVTERIVQGTLDALPPYSPPPFPVPAAAERVALFDWMVLTCYPEELRRQQHLADLAAAERDVLREVAAQQQANGNLDQLPAAGTEQGDYRGLRLD